MADETPGFAPTQAETNRGREQGLGVGQRELDAQRDPSREQYAINPGRLEPFDDDNTGGDDDPGDEENGREASRPATRAGKRPQEARAIEPDEREALQDGPDRIGADGLDPALSRNEVGIHDGGQLGAGTPANVDIHKLGEQDNPDLDWGDAEPGAVHSQTNTRRAVHTEGERGQGAKTRQAIKDQVSRRR